MPKTRKKDKIGLALSGGGYRAATYHIGTLQALKELGVLDKVDVISTNSGGSIAGACYSLYHKDFKKFEEVLVSGVQKSVIHKVVFHPRILIPLLVLFGIVGFSICLLFTPYAWLNLLIWPAVFILLAYAQFEILPVSKIIEKIYDELFFNKQTLSHLSKDFLTTIISTNMETGRVFQFSRQRMGDTAYGYREGEKAITFNPKLFPISRAVMASSCVPLVFTPVNIAKEFFKDASQYDEVSPKLVDGGIYDNQGIHKLTFKGSPSFCEHVIISDAGAKMPFQSNYKNMITLLVRSMDVFMARIKNIQMMNKLFRVPVIGDSTVAYQSLSFDLDRSISKFMEMLKGGYIAEKVIRAHSIPKDFIKDRKWKSIENLVSKNINLNAILQKGCTQDELEIARGVGTNLTPLRKEQTETLIKHAKAITELQVKLYLPHVL